MTAQQNSRHSASQSGRFCAGVDCSVELPVQTSGRRRKWCSARCRKRTLYGGQCVDCGARTDGSNGRDAAPQRCKGCEEQRGHDERYWTPERLIAEVQRFHAEYGRPPRQIDWFGNAKSQTCRRVDWVPLEGKWPAPPLAFREFGSWNAMIEAAGFRPFDHALDHDWGVGKLSPTIRRAA